MKENSKKDSDVVAKGLIVDSDGLILLLQRGDTGQRWDIPGGHVHIEEEKKGLQGILKGFKRELFEETGLKIKTAEKVSEFSITWKGNTNPIYLFKTLLNKPQPDIDLYIQDFQENIDFVWVSPSKTKKYLKNCTEVMEKAIQWAIDDTIEEEKEPWYKRKRRQEKSKGMKNTLVGKGNNTHIAAKGMKKASTKHSKSAPPDVGVLEESKNIKSSIFGNLVDE